MRLHELVCFGIREWSDFGLWIAEQYASLDTQFQADASLTTRTVKPEEWVAPIQYDTMRDAAVRHSGSVVYHRVEAYRGGGV